MPYFTDKKGRKILIEVFGDDAYAQFEGVTIGDVRTSGLREVDPRVADLPAQITGWDVKREFQRAGIATEMVRLLSEELGTLVPAERDIGQGDKNALTDDGYWLTVACQKLGYVYPFPEESDFEDEDDDDE